MIFKAQVSVDKVGQQAVVLLAWRPLSVCRCSGHLLVLNPSGGRWKFALVLNAKDAEIDGTLVCEAHVGCTASVPVNLFASGAGKLMDIQCRLNCEVSGNAQI
jgi:hypothetical protein